VLLESEIHKCVRGCQPPKPFIEGLGLVLLSRLVSADLFGKIVH
jgi:hypothetical protein